MGQFSFPLFCFSGCEIKSCSCTYMTSFHKLLIVGVLGYSRKIDLIFFLTQAKLLLEIWNPKGYQIAERCSWSANILPFLCKYSSILTVFGLNTPSLWFFFFGQMQLRPMCKDIKKCVKYGSYGNTKLPVNSDLFY